MTTSRDITGQKFGRLTAVRYLRTLTFPSGSVHQLWEFVCDCRRVKEALKNQVKRGTIKSCGCLAKQYYDRYRSIGKRPLTQAEKYRKHKPKRLAAVAVYRSSHREQMREYQKAHRDYFRLKAAERRARESASTVNPKATLKWLNLIKSKARVRCYYCDKAIPKDELHVDHVIPLVQRGIHAIENLAAACAKCNQTKSRSKPAEWYREGQQFLNL